MDGEVTKVAPEKDKGGTWVTFGNEAYKVPPLSFRQIQQLRERIEALGQMSSMPSGDQMDGVLDIVHAALTRNYPALTRDAVADMVDLGNFLEVLTAVVRIAGFRQREEGAPGETTASTGTISTSP